MNTKHPITFLLAIILVLMNLGCSGDGTIEEVRVMRINHFKVTDFGFVPILALSVQIDDQIDTNIWQDFSEPIDGFEFEPGYITEIIFEVEELEDPPADGSSLRYSLVRVLNREKVDATTMFTVNLKENGIDYVQRSPEHSLLNQIPIDCQDLCQELDSTLDFRNSVKGSFIHGGDGAIILQDIL